MVKSIFKRLLPTLRMEAGCALSIVGLFLFLEYGGHRHVPQAMLVYWRTGEIGELLFAVVLLVAGLMALLLPFVSCAIGSSLHRRFGAFGLAFSVIVLVCAEGWAASDALGSLYEGPRIYGVPWNGILGVVALAELAILIFGGVVVLDDRPFLMSLVGTRDADWTLLAINFVVTAIVLFLIPLQVDLAPPEAALLALHLIFAVTLIRKPAESIQESEPA